MNCFFLAQLLIIIVCITISLLVTNVEQAQSAGLGGIVAFIPAWLFAKKVFKYQGITEAKRIIKQVYLGEFIKIVTSIALFSFVFFYVDIAGFEFFLTYIIVVLSHWLVPLIINYPQSRRQSD